jgi:hypothetical protein
MRSDDQVFKSSPLYRCVPVVVMLGAAAGLLVLGLRGGIHYGHGFNFPGELAYFIAAVFAVFGLFFGLPLQASMKSRTNWIVRQNRKGIIIKYRSFENWRMPADDVQAVGFDFTEIAWARKFHEQRTFKGMDDSTRSESITYVDFCLNTTDTDALETHLQAERARNWKFVSREYPVELLPEGILRVRWTGIFPRADAALQKLARELKIADAVSEKTDFTSKKIQTVEEKDAQILKLLNSGDKMTAIKLTREVYGCSLSDAIKYVDDVQSGKKIGLGKA